MIFKKIDIKEEEKEKCRDYIIRSLLVTSGNKRIEYFPKKYNCKRIWIGQMWQKMIQIFIQIIKIQKKRK
jgi:hypothetical protein